MGTLRITAELQGDVAADYRLRAARLDSHRRTFVADLTAQLLAQTAAYTPRRTGQLALGFENAQQTARFDETTDRTIATAVNTVRYAGFVEYGTRKMTARAMLRRAIAAIRPLIPRLWSHAEPDSR